MSTVMAEKAGSRPFRPSFHFWITVVMALFVFGGFATTYWIPVARGAIPFPPIVHLHGVVFSLWMVMLVVQSLLVNVRNVPLHRSLGTFGIALATAMIVLSFQITVMFGHFALADPMPDYYILMYLGIAAVLSFATQFTLAMRNTRRPEYHRRLILLATLPILPPGINRLYMAIWQLDRAPILATYLTMDAMALAILMHDLTSMKKVSRATWIGGSLLLAQQIIHPLVIGTEGFARFCKVLTDLAVYR